MRTLVFVLTAALLGWIPLGAASEPLDVEPVNPCAAGHAVNPCAAKRAGFNSWSWKSPLPMCRLIGRSTSCAAFQIGFQWESPSSGIPKSWGALVKRIARCPRSRQRRISATAASTSQNGVAITGMKRRGSGSIHSMSQPL